MNNLKVMVLGSGQDIVGEVVSEDASLLQVKNARIVGLDQQSKQITFYVFTAHADKSTDAVIPINKDSLITWYPAGTRMVSLFDEALKQYRAKLSGIVLAGSGIVK